MNVDDNPHGCVEEDTHLEGGQWRVKVRELGVEDHENSYVEDMDDEVSQWTICQFLMLVSSV